MAHKKVKRFVSPKFVDVGGFKKKEIAKAPKIVRPYEEGQRHICRSTAENADRPVFVHRDTL